uniref:SWIM-type domain-containing protein n=1 Tax=Globisporangium ultimum (strain ATCC 200006 / CBS 805.95 / DAOM BR144) TaxID=431595 RepID=K3WLS0_GLOUD
MPYRAKVPEQIRMRIEQTLATTMYLVQTTGPTSYVIQEQNNETKHKILIGSLQNCSCGDRDVCVHILFVMLKILRVPATTPVVWQKSLIDSEVGEKCRFYEIEMLLRGDYREQSRAAPSKTMSSFLRKRKDTSGVPLADTSNEAEVERHELVEGEVCAICQEDMADNQPLTFCRKGCGNNFHVECSKYLI